MEESPVTSPRYSYSPYEGSQDKVLYGEVDGRRNLKEVLNDAGIPDEERKRIRSVANRVACLMPSKYLQHTGERYTLKGNVPYLRDTKQQDEMLGSDIPMGEKESFFNEHTPGRGTAYLVGRDVVLTAAHCVCHPETDKLNQTIIDSISCVFKFHSHLKKEGYRTRFKTDDVYTIKSIVAWCYIPKKEKDGQDWALLQLDRPVKGREPLTISFGWELAKRQPVYMLGHPSGLPMKYTGTAEVKDTSAKRENLFGTNLDAFTGNSGSPLLRPGSTEVIGMLVSGHKDYAIDHNYQGKDEPRLKASVITDERWETAVRVTSLKFVRAFLPSLNAVPVTDDMDDFKPGLSLEGVCNTEECERTNVVVHLGFSQERVFNLSKECCVQECPDCSKTLPWDTVNTMALTNCQYVIEAGDDRDIRVIQRARLPKYHVFRFDVQTWYYIEANVQPLE